MIARHSGVCGWAAVGAALVLGIGVTVTRAQSSPAGFPNEPSRAAVARMQESGQDENNVDEKKDDKKDDKDKKDEKKPPQ